MHYVLKDHKFFYICFRLHIKRAITYVLYLFQMEKADGTYESAISYFPVYTKGTACFLHFSNLFKIIFFIP